MCKMIIRIVTILAAIADIASFFVANQSLVFKYFFAVYMIAMCEYDPSVCAMQKSNSKCDGNLQQVCTNLRGMEKLKCLADNGIEHTCKN